MKGTGTETSRLSAANGYDGIFSIVKSHVEEVLGLHRAGLTLGPGTPPDGHRGLPLGRIQHDRPEQGDSRQGEERGAPRDCDLLHIHAPPPMQYLHSLGFLDEAQVRKTSEEVAGRVLGTGHPASVLIRTPLTELFPYLGALRYAEGPQGDIEVVRNFDSRSYRFIS